MRKAKIERKTRETEIKIEVNLEGKGNYKIETNYGFLTHMLELFSRFSGIDIKLKAKGDIEVDTHHLVEDTGICLGQAIKKALGDKKGIRRYGFSSMPMDETLINVSLDISGRPFLVFNVPDFGSKDNSFKISDAKEFFKAFVNHSGITIHTVSYTHLTLPTICSV